MFCKTLRMSNRYYRKKGSQNKIRLGVCPIKQSLAGFFATGVNESLYTYTTTFPEVSPPHLGKCCERNVANACKSNPEVKDDSKDSSLSKLSILELLTKVG